MRSLRGAALLLLLALLPAGRGAVITGVSASARHRDGTAGRAGGRRVVRGERVPGWGSPG